MNDSAAGRKNQKKHQQQHQQRQRQHEQEERLYNLLSSIGHLSEYGDVPVYAFGTLISTAPPQAIAEHLHQRWLSDPNYAHIAPKIVLQMSSNVTVCSQVLSFALRDFNTRYEIRTQSKGMFRNFVRTLIELYPVYRQIDKCLSSCLIEPIFRSLQILVDEEPDDMDLNCLANIIINSGQQLSQLNVGEVDRLVLACRRWLCSNRIPLEEDTRQLLMNVIDLWTYSWDRNLFPDCLRRYYEQWEEQKQMRTHLVATSSRSIPSVLDQPLSNIPPSGSSQQMTDSASSSLPSSAMALDSTQQTKSLPQSRTSIATLTALPAYSSTTAVNVAAGTASAAVVAAADASALPNGDMHKLKKKLIREARVEEELEKVARSGEEDKESLV